jgi:flagellar hook-associated protein 2
METIDAAAVAQQFVQAIRGPADSRLNRDETIASAKLEAYKQLEASLDAVLTQLKPSSTAESTKVSIAKEGFFTVNASTAAPVGSFSVGVERLATQSRQSLAFNNVNWNLPTDGALAIDINGSSMEIDFSTMSTGSDLTDLRDAINDHAANVGVTATIVLDGTGAAHLMLTSDNAGEAEEISMSVSGDVASDGPLKDLAEIVVNRQELTKAVDAQITLNGLLVTSSSNVIEDAIEGVSIELIKATESEGPVDFSIDLDNSDYVAQMNAFVDSYNQLVSDIDRLRGEGSGEVLAGDSFTRNMMAQISDELHNVGSNQSADPVDMYELGLKFGSDGKITLDEDTLKETLEDDPDKVAAIFEGDASLFNRLGVIIENYVESDGYFDTKETTLDAKLDRVTESREALDLRMESLYNRYLTEFTYLNRILLQLNSTENLLT